MGFDIGGCTIRNVVFLLCAILARTDENDNIIQSMKQAVFDIYDENRTLMHNYFSILALLCPESLFCSENNVSVSVEEGYKEFWIDENSTNATYRTDEKIRYARQYLLETKDQLSGCCEPCSCDLLCIEKHNCCPEFQLRKVNITNEFVQRQECFFASIKSYSSEKYNRKDEFGKTYFAVTDCFTSKTNESTIYKCQNPNKNNMEEIVPVYSNISTRIYRNKYCAECNNDSDVVPWTLEVNINTKLTLTAGLPASPQELHKVIVIPRYFKYFDAYFNPPIDLDFEDNSCYSRSGKERSCTRTDKIESEYDVDVINRRLCTFNQSLYHTSHDFYRNVFCYLCDNDEIPESPMKCTSSTRSVSGSFAAILLPLSSVETEKNINTQGPCKCNEYFNRKLKECRELRCPPGTYFAPCECLNFIEITSLPIHVYLEISPTGHVEELLQPEIRKDWLDKLVKSIKYSLMGLFAPAQSRNTLIFREMSKANRSYVKLYTSLLTQFKGSQTRQAYIQHTFNVLHKGLSINVENHKLILKLGILYTLDPSDDNPFPDHERFKDSDTKIDYVLTTSERELSQVEAKHIQPFNKLIYCSRVVMSQIELELLNNNTRIQELYQDLQYIFKKEDSSLCLEDYIDTMVESCSSSVCSKNVIILLMYKGSLSFAAFMTWSSFF